MECLQFAEKILDVYYDEASDAVQVLARKHRQNCSSCQQAWQNLEKISQVFQSLPLMDPAPAGLDRILACAERQIQEKQSMARVSVWRISLSVAAMLLFSILGYFAGLQKHPLQTQIASSSPEISIFSENTISPQLLLSERFLKTPLDDGFRSDYQLNRFLPDNALVSSASQGLGGFGVDDELDRKMLSRNLSFHELETLYFRARKLEKMGQYREALDDFEFLAKLYPKYENYPYVLLSMARCLQSLNQKDNAIAVLRSFQQTQGSSKQIQSWIDELKSETF